ncbi:MAG: hypothetical protein DWB56_06815 [Candidatus Jettenia sp.]|uniref:Putative DNA primase n=1 Tax=Candidatus Jettenia caeni TaxID=247490 RepID=I3IMY9_9BACT|nr:CHC2 zinc finger domain-containing protein [Candidatus Jettenia sp. AMX1]MBC6928665.1 hypothetical protein [Candidatus Jettenia sp.]GAB63084.1 putative DNA primase [Candidatus Jettenia caeni]KAA0250643.1 MAG: hypothetical protein EDM77_03755 [Candidatus Jettenia sp. AMX1]MCE7879977.1 hypothetical protein [Candidatus Jettenia sp. AMX1]MCQ3926759.1 hypothetical protein [Candidatus Jettenia sp.]
MNDFETIKNRLSIIDLLHAYKAEKKGRFANPSPCCNHNDCMSIDEDKNLWKCFSCGNGGSVIDLIMVADQCNESEALKKASEMIGYELQNQYQEKEEKKETAQERMYRLAAEYYHQAMVLEGSQGREWFCNVRGHTESTLQFMGAGWTTGGLLSFLQGQSFTPAECLSFGLARDKDKDGKQIPVQDYYWQGLVVFPVVDHSGNVISFTCKDPLKKVKGLLLKGAKKTWFLNHQTLGKHQETFLVEGENDRASLLDVGINNVIGTAGAPNAEQVTLLKNFYPNKTLYLWFDKDPQKDFRKNEGGPHHTRFIYQGLQEEESIKVKIITHPGTAKDPDEYIQKLRKEGCSAADIRNAVKALKDQALDPLAWEIEMLKSIPEPKDRLETLKIRQIPHTVSRLHSKAEQEVYTTLIAQTIGITTRAAEDLVMNSTDLSKELSIAFGEDAELKRADGTRVADQIFKWFSNGAGARFFKTSDKKVWIFYRGQIYEIGNNIDFNSLIFRLTRLTAIEKPGPVVWYSLQTLCNIHGEYVALMSWLYTDKEKDTIYVNLSSPHNKIIKLTAGEDPKVIDNGTNENSVLLSSSPQMKPFEYQPNVALAEGFRAVKTLLMDTIPAEGPQRYFLMCWIISVFIMNYQGDRGLVQILGDSSLGKSKIGERTSQLIYGENYSGRGTDAADDRTAAQNPVVFQDNLENRNLTQKKVDFLLLLANSANKPKAKTGSDTENIYQKLNSMGMISSIEAFPGKLPELVNRTFSIILEDRFKISGYTHDEVMRSISKQRNFILSAILKMISKSVLPRLSERTEWSKYLNTRFPKHNKDRNNEHLCTMMVILEALLEYIPSQKDTEIKKQAADLLERWITYQEEQAKQTAVTSNTLLTLMDGLVKEVWIKIRGRADLQYQSITEYPDKRVLVFDDPEYLETFYLTESQEEISEDEDYEGLTESIQRLEMIVTAADLFTIFNRYCANQHIKNPYDSPNALGARISNDKEVMKKGGWEYISRKEGEIKYKKIMGKWYWKFSKKMRVLR